MIALTAATKQEVDGVSRYIGQKQMIADAGCLAWKGTYRDREVLILQTGIGKSRVESAISSILASYRLTALVSLGFGGALIRELTAGDIVLCSTIYYVSGSGGGPEVEPQHSSPRLFQSASEALGKSGLNWIQGNGITISWLAATPADKRSLRGKHQAEVCEMEDYWIAQMAKIHQVPFLSVRVISDDMRTTLPDYKQIIKDNGNLRLVRAVPYFLAHPGFLVKLPTLYRQSNQAKNNLSAFVSRFLEIV